MHESGTSNAGYAFSKQALVSHGSIVIVGKATIFQSLFNKLSALLPKIVVPN